MKIPYIGVHRGISKTACTPCTRTLLPEEIAQLDERGRRLEDVHLGAGCTLAGPSDALGPVESLGFRDI
jgi:hypothetical protein